MWGEYEQLINFFRVPVIEMLESATAVTSWVL